VSADVQATGPLDVAVDNDILIKAACYGLTHELENARRLGVLGAAKYVVAGRIKRMPLAGDHNTACASALNMIARSSVLEPSSDELHLAASVETAAQRRGLELDAGESQLAAMVVHRCIPLLETGDKRAIKGFDALLDEIAELAPLRGRLRCLEQIVFRCADRGDPDALARAVCAERRVDKALTICCCCFTPPPHGPALDRAGLHSYITALRAAAPRVLEP
jgi:hypothetical protein